MIARCTEVVFRGEPRIVVVDKCFVDEETNCCDVEWHFEDTTPEQHDALDITDAEEDAIIEEIQKAVHDGE